MSLPPVYVGVRRLGLAAVVATGLAQAACVLGTALLMQRALDAAIVGGPAERLAWLLGGIGALAAIAAGCRWLERRESERLGHHYVHELRLAMFRSLAERLPDERRREGSGTVPLRFVTDLTAIRQWISQGQARLIVALLVLAATLVFVATVDPGAALAVIGVLAAGTAVSLALGRRLEQAVSESRLLRGRLANLIAEKVGSLPSIVGFGRLHSERLRLQRYSLRLTDSMNARAHWSGALRAVSDLSVRLSVALVLALGLLELRSGAVSAGAVFAAVSIVALLGAPVRDLGRVQEYWKAAVVARRKLARLLDLDAARPPRRNLTLAEPRGEIALRDVALGDGRPAFQAVVESGTRLAVLGGSGSGKTTLLMMLAGIRRPSSGRVVVDGQAVDRLERHSLRRAIGFASPDLALMRGTLRRNLRYRAPEATPLQLREACEQAGLIGLFGAWPELLERRIGEGGSGLSDGERVRVQLARALVGVPRILLLDEMDSRLDAEGRELFQRIVLEYPGTVVFSTRDPAVAGLADLCWRLDVDGVKTTDAGTHAVLPWRLREAQR